MSGFFGVVSKKDCVMELFFGVDYHSHLGTKRGGLVVHGENGFQRSIHNIENSPFRTKFERDVDEFKGESGIGCISDNEAQPLIVHSHLGSFAITTVGRINNMDELMNLCFASGKVQFLESSKGQINQTEMVAALINLKNSVIEGLTFAQEHIKGSMSILLLFPDKIYACRDKFGRTPIIIGSKKGAHCAVFESSSFVNLGFKYVKDLGPGEIVSITSDNVVQEKAPGTKKKVCSFLWTYYGYPTATYEGINVEVMRYRCGKLLRNRDEITADAVAGVPDSGVPHAIGYANASGIPYTRPFIKYTPTWPRSFTPHSQAQRNLIAHMKLIPVEELIKNQKLVLIDDSIVRGTQLRETTDFLYNLGAKEVHVRPACPPIMFGCKYLNFTRSTTEMDLITRKVIAELEGTEEISEELLNNYINPDHPKYHEMIEEIRKRMHFDSLKYHRLDDLIEAIGLPECELCTYCFNGKQEND